VPLPARRYWDRIPEAKMVLGQIRAAKSQVQKLLTDDPMWVEVGLNGAIGSLNDAANRFSNAMPAYVCPFCKGLKPESCRECTGRGVISKFMWNFVPEELKK